MRILAVYFAVMSHLLAGCKTTDESDLAGRDTIAHSLAPNYDHAQNLKLNEEYAPIKERLYFRQIVRDFHKIHQEQQQLIESQDIKRGMHAKSHGCYEATFQVLRLKEQLRHGIFAVNQETGQPKTYPAVVRFSNGSGIIQSDLERDLRGLAVKLYDSEMPALRSDMNPGEQDFLMTNAPVHHAKDIVELMGFIKANHAGGAEKAAFLATNIRLTRTLLKQTGRSVISMLAESYYSRAAFRLGPEQSMRFEVDPCERVYGPQKEDPDYLSSDLDEQFKRKGSGCFHFYARLQTDPVKEPIEDHSVEWTSSRYLLARLQIHGDKKLTNDSCERLRFNPWNAHQDHQPLGNFNRARLAIYNEAWRLRSGQ